jgi:hypothetical protein
MFIAARGPWFPESQVAYLQLPIIFSSHLSKDISARAGARYF